MAQLVQIRICPHNQPNCFHEEHLNTNVYCEAEGRLDSDGGQASWSWSDTDVISTSSDSSSAKDSGGGTSVDSDSGTINGASTRHTQLSTSLVSDSVGQGVSVHKHDGIGWSTLRTGELGSRYSVVGSNSEGVSNVGDQWWGADVSTGSSGGGNGGNKGLGGSSSGVYVESSGTSESTP